MILHIFNGESTRYIFEKSGLEGSWVTWGEMLSDGPCSVNFMSPEYAQLRKDFFEQELGIPSGLYESKALTAFRAIAETSADEIVLWFEYDWFCQINLMGLCSLLYTHQKHKKISLICVGKEGDRLYGLGEVEAEKYEKLFTQRQILSKKALQFGAVFWEKYCQSDPNELIDWVKQCPPEFEYLPDAFVAYLKLYPDSQTRITEVEKALLQCLPEVENMHQLVGKLLKWQTWYGFGDLQYEFYIKKIFSALQIDIKDAKKQKVMAVDLDRHRESIKLRFGGCHQNHFRFDAKKNKLIRCLNDL